MSWETKKDYCNLAVEGKLSVKSDDKNVTGQYLEKLGKNGDYKATKVFGVRAAPANTYTIEDDVTIEGKELGEVNTVDQKKYALESIKFSSGADQEPTLEATSKQVADDAETRNTFEVPEFSMSPDHVAQIPAFKFSGDQAAVPAFSLPEGTQQAPTNQGVELQTVSGEISCNVKTNDRNGDPKAHDVTTAHIVLQLSISQYGEQEPTITPAEGWDMSAPKTDSDPDSDFKTWTCTLTRPLAKKMAE